MKKLIFALFALIMIIGNINICLADSDNQQLLIKSEHTSNNDTEFSRQIDKLIKGKLTDGSASFEFDSSLRIKEVIVKKDNSEILVKREDDYVPRKNSISSIASGASLILHKSELGIGNFRVDFINEDGSRAYTTFTIFTIK